MPAFCVSPNKSPLGLFSSISSVMGRLPAGPLARVLISKMSDAGVSNSSLQEFMETI